MIDPKHLRLSECARCPRGCALRGRGAEPAPITEADERRFERGHYDEGWIASRFKAKYAPKHVLQQIEIRWPEEPKPQIGTGHADLWIPSERLLVEIKSSTSPDSLLDSAVAQARMYLRFHPKARRAVVFILNPTDLSELRIPVLLHSSHIEEIDARVEQVRAAVSSEGPLPPCVYSTPSECRHSFCAFTDAAWEGWEAPSTRWTGATMEAMVAELWAAKEDKDQAKHVSDQMDTRWKEVCAQASALGLEPGVEHECGPFVVKRTLVSPRKTFSLSRAEKSGAWTSLDEERFEFAISIGEGSERWSIKHSEDRPAVSFPSVSADGGSSPAASTAEAGEPPESLSAPASDTHSVRAELLA